MSSLKYQFEPGDLIVMVTDGLLDSRFHVAERDVWLCKALEKINNDSPQVIADSLMAQAKANTNLVKDDMAVLVARSMNGKCRFNTALEGSREPVF